MLIFVSQSADIGPCALYKEYVTCVETYLGEIVENIVPVASHRHDVDIVFGTKARLLDFMVLQGGIGHNDQFRNTDIIEVHLVLRISLLFRYGLF